MYQKPAHARRSNENSYKLVNFTRSNLTPGRIQLCFSQKLEPVTVSTIPLPNGNSKSASRLHLYLHSNKPTGSHGEARQSGNSAIAAELAVLSKWASIF
jgi:hypothetical protein